MDIHSAARKHGVADADITHAVTHRRSVADRYEEHVNTKKRRTSGGIELTEEVIEQLTSDAERGYDVKQLKRAGRRGRPPLGSRAAKTFQVRLDPDLRAALESRAKAERITPSDLARRALREYLRPDRLRRK